MKSALSVKRWTWVEQLSSLGFVLAVLGLGIAFREVSMRYPLPPDLAALSLIVALCSGGLFHWWLVSKRGLNNKASHATSASYTTAPVAEPPKLIAEANKVAIAKLNDARMNKGVAPLTPEEVNVYQEANDVLSAGKLYGLIALPLVWAAAIYISGGNPISMYGLLASLLAVLSVVAATLGGCLLVIRARTSKLLSWHELQTALKYQAAYEGHLKKELWPD